MAKDRYSLYPGEKILLKESCVRHGFWAAFTDELILTTQRIIHVKIGMVANFKGTDDYPLSEIDQVIIGTTSTGEKQLELYHNGTMEDFAFQDGNKRKLQIWTMAVADRFSADADAYDFNYYQSLSDESLKRTIQAQNVHSYSQTPIQNNGDDDGFIEGLAKNVLKSGNLSLNGVIKGVEKTYGKQMRKRLFSEISDELIEDLGLTELQDDFRESVGLTPKNTHPKITEEQLNAAFELKLSESRARISAQHNSKPKSSVGQSSAKGNSDYINKPLDILKKLKELADAGVLTQEEFKSKKKQILDSYFK